jgi:HNH endonuclease
LLLDDFLSASLADPGAPWSRDGLRGIARLQVPDRVFGSLEDVLRGDVHRQWASWFLGTICDVDAYARSGTEYAYIFTDVLARVRSTMTELSARDGNELASQVAKLAYGEARRRAGNRARTPLDRALRRQLIDCADGKPHCWVCGWRFQAEAVDRFLELSEDPPGVPDLIDIFKPIGLNRRHLRIEVDHVAPFSRGGADRGDNLRLCCGWCNAHKSDRSSIYEVSGESRTAGGTNAARALPQPFWVVRVLAMEAERGGLSPKDGELTVALRNPKGAVNPANLVAVTYDNDPMGAERFQNYEVASKTWRRAEPD